MARSLLAHLLPPAHHVRHPHSGIDGLDAVLGGGIIHIYLEDVSGKLMPRIRVLKSTAREFLRAPVKLAYDSE